MLCTIFCCLLRAHRRSAGVSSHRKYQAIVAARLQLQRKYFHLHGVSNNKLNSLLKLLRVSECTTVTGSLDFGTMSIAALRRRHDRFLARRMRYEDRVYLKNMLLWPLGAEAEVAKIREMENVMAEVERVLDVLAEGPEHKFLR